MENYTTTYNEQKKHFEFREEGFTTALVVNVQSGMYDATDSCDWMEVIPLNELAVATSYYSKGKHPCGDCEGELTTDPYYWLVRRDNGKLYPFPLLFTSQSERENSAQEYNSRVWDFFYAGLYDPAQLDRGLVDVPTEGEIIHLIALLELVAAPEASKWEDLDQPGGLVPRWAARPY